MVGITEQFVLVRTLVLEVAEMCFCQLILEALCWDLNVQGKDEGQREGGGQSEIRVPDAEGDSSGPSSPQTL